MLNEKKRKVILPESISNELSPLCWRMSQAVNNNETGDILSF